MLEIITIKDSVVEPVEHNQLRVMTGNKRISLDVVNHWYSALTIADATALRDVLNRAIEDASHQVYTVFGPGSVVKRNLLGFVYTIGDKGYIDHYDGEYVLFSNSGATRADFSSENYSLVSVDGVPVV